MHCKAQAGVGNVDEMDDAQTKKKNKKRREARCHDVQRSVKRRAADDDRRRTTPVLFVLCRQLVPVCIVLFQRLALRHRNAGQEEQNKHGEDRRQD